MPNEEVQDYIKKQLEEGHTKQEIEEALINAGWAKEDINRAFRALSKNSNTSTSPSGNKKSVAAAVAILLLLISAVLGGSLVLRGDDSGDDPVEDFDIAEEVNEEEIRDEDESDEREDTEEDDSDEGDYMEDGEPEEVTLSEADSCQKGQFEVDFILNDDEFDIPLVGEISFHGLENGYCGVSYSLDIPEEDWDEVEEMVINEFGLNSVEYPFDPHYIGEENFCFMTEEDFSSFHKEIQEGVVVEEHLSHCMQTSFQSEEEFNDFRGVIKKISDGNYLGEIRWSGTAVFPWKNTYTEKIKLMGHPDEKKCFYKKSSQEEEMLEEVPGLAEDDPMTDMDLGAGHCVVPCDGLVDYLLAGRSTHSLTFRTLDNPEGLDYSETIAREDGTYEVFQYQTNITNEVPCVYASDKLIEKDPNIDSAEEIFEALSNHEEVQGDNSN